MSDTGQAQAITAIPAAVAPAQATPAPGAPAGFDSVPAQSTKAAPKPAAPAKAETYDVTVDGKSIKMTLDEMKKHAGLGKKAYSNLEEAAKIRKDAESKLDRIKTPKDAMKFLTDPKNGYDAKEVRAAFEEWYSEAFIEPETMTPEQKRWAQMERENKELKAEREAQQKEAQAAREAEEDSRTGQQLQSEITSMLEESGMPKTKFTASRMAYWIRVNESKGINAPKEMIIEQVRTERNNIVKSMADSYDGEALVQHLGEDIVKKIRQFDLARIRAKRGGTAPVEGQKAPTTDEQPEKISTREVKRRARDLFR